MLHWYWYTVKHFRSTLNHLKVQNKIRNSKYKKIIKHDSVDFSKLHTVVKVQKQLKVSLCFGNNLQPLKHLSEKMSP